MFCKNCGQEIDDKAVVCPHCGVAQREMSYDTIKDDGGVGWGILGCCIPVVGLILWLVWKDSKPNTAKAAGIGALVSVGLAALWYIFVFALGIGGAMMF
ncbi:zinc ribbon domain-containing protein [Massilimicrobiota sp. An142]|uniref:zinc-ribbon domain-containing protein n=1 Tax=Massilimicrobiota sp. An142 TaxID=1965564 RepID=UPI000B3787B0|nr:zinc ribbon domain-containing protein [Massilimicrobiota sp. An142]OUQ13888.1 zinc ribbon domain-containing protein [Massilimicrobiota sp. An142]